MGRRWSNYYNKPNQDVSEAIKLHADSGSSQTIQMTTTKAQPDGTDGAGAIDIEATNGGIGLRWNNSKHLWAEEMDELL